MIIHRNTKNQPETERAIKTVKTNNRDFPLVCPICT